ncbi:MAG: transcription elongation factor GreB [Deltaproteobacteria bacterium]|nr:transcription elongation factor GreB [Deltaproteobacteria bacterium]
MTEQKSYVTPAGYKRLQDEAQRLLRIERPTVVREVSDAAAQGDRSENAEYIYGKKRLREIDSRLRFLDKRLRVLEIIDPETQRGDRVNFGAIVTLESEDGQRKVWQLVGEDESEPSEGRISYKSPLARALSGKQAGDDFSFKRPDGRETEYVVESVVFPKSSG